MTRRFFLFLFGAQVLVGCATSTGQTQSVCTGGPAQGEELAIFAVGLGRYYEGSGSQGKPMSMVTVRPPIWGADVGEAQASLPDGVPWDELKAQFLKGSTWEERLCLNTLATQLGLVEPEGGRGIRLTRPGIVGDWAYFQIASGSRISGVLERKGDGGWAIVAMGEIAEAFGAGR